MHQQMPIHAMPPHPLSELDTYVEHLCHIQNTWPQPSHPHNPDTNYPNPISTEWHTLKLRITNALAGANDIRRRLQIIQDNLYITHLHKHPFANPALEEDLERHRRICDALDRRDLNEFKDSAQYIINKYTDLSRITNTILAIDISRIHYNARQIADKHADIYTPQWNKRYLEYIETNYYDLWKPLLCHIKDCTQNLAKSLGKECLAYIGRLRRCINTYLSSHHEYKTAVAQLQSLAYAAHQLAVRNTIARTIAESPWTAVHIQADLARSTAPALSDDDHRLINLWANKNNDRFWREATRSARRAELAAIQVYSSLGYKVEDLSILQLADQDPDRRWIIADLLVNSRYVDIKNARRSLSSKNSYPNHLIKKFKQSAQRDDVIISAFLSDYVKDTDTSPPGDIIWLGETSKRMLETLADEYRSDYLLIDDLDESGHRVPPWAFDYPESFYANRDQAIRSLISNPPEPPYDGLCLPYYLLAKQLNNLMPQSTAVDEARRIARRIGSAELLTRGRLFLHILDRFCESIQQGSAFRADAIRQAIFGPSDLPANRHLPLAILDPLETVASLLDVLEYIDNPTTSRLLKRHYKQFHLKGPRILYGIAADGTRDVLIAYCGGRKSPLNVPCGYEPLYIGKHGRCESCRKLICPECRFCSMSCSSNTSLDMHCDMHGF